MDPGPMQRTFRNPSDVRGIPGVTKHTPIPPREKPLPGTKTMRFPKDEHLRELVTGRTVEVILPSLTAKILGILAIIFAVGLIACYWINRIFDVEEVGFPFNFLGLGLFHLLVLFSYILSSGRNLLGVWAIVVLYSGIVSSVAVEWILP